VLGACDKPVGATDIFCAKAKCNVATAADIFCAKAAMFKKKLKPLVDVFKYLMNEQKAASLREG